MQCVDHTALNEANRLSEQALQKIKQKSVDNLLRKCYLLIMKTRQSITIDEKDRDFLKEIAESSDKHKGKVSTGIRILVGIYRTITNNKRGKNAN